MEASVIFRVAVFFVTVFGIPLLYFFLCNLDDKLKSIGTKIDKVFEGCEKEIEEAYKKGYTAAEDFYNQWHDFEKEKPEHWTECLVKLRQKGERCSKFSVLLYAYDSFNGLIDDETVEYWMPLKRDAIPYDMTGFSGTEI